jgi:hypothetical protein
VSTPDTLSLKRHRDLVGRSSELWGRRTVIAILCIAPILAAFNVFGQQPDTTTVSSPAAKLSLYTPDKLRGGLLFSSRFHIHAHKDIKQATLVLDEGWAEGMAINTIEPSPVGEASRDGKLAFDLGHIPAGSSYVLYMQFQVNPTNVAWHRPQNVELDDGDTKLLSIKRDVTIFP